MSEVLSGLEPEEGASGPTDETVFDAASWRARRETIDRWGAAFGHGDAAEVDRLVQQSRAERLGDANAGLLGQMLGQRDTSAADGVTP